MARSRPADAMLVGERKRAVLTEERASDVDGAATRVEVARRLDDVSQMRRRPSKLPERIRSSPFLISLSGKEEGERMSTQLTQSLCWKLDR